jgi:hypothetical protein
MREFCSSIIINTLLFQNNLFLLGLMILPKFQKIVFPLEYKLKLILYVSNQPMN